MSNQPPGRAPDPDQAAVDERGEASTRSALGRKVRTGAWVGLAIVVTVFLLSNAQSVEVSFVFTSVEMPLWIVLGVAVLLGAALAAGFIGLRSHRRSRARRSQRRGAGTESSG